MYLSTTLYSTMQRVKILNFKKKANVVITNYMQLYVSPIYKDLFNPD